MKELVGTGYMVQTVVNEVFDYIWQTEIFNWIKSNSQDKWEIIFNPDMKVNSAGDIQVYSKAEIIVIFKEKQDATMFKLRWS